MDSGAWHFEGDNIQIAMKADSLAPLFSGSFRLSRTPQANLC